MAGWHIGVIGGSGLYEPGELDDAQTIAVGSAFGEPSSPVAMGRIGHVKFSVHRPPRRGAHPVAGQGQLPRQHRRAQALRRHRRAGDQRDRLAARGTEAGRVRRRRPVHRPHARARAELLRRRASSPMSASPTRSARGWPGSLPTPPARPEPRSIAAALTSPSRARNSRPAPKATSTATGAPT